MIKITSPIVLSVALSGLLVALSGCGSSDGGISGTGDPTVMTPADISGSPDNNSTPNGGSVTAGATAGTLDTATPEFQWSATDGADAYQIVLTDPGDNQITYDAGTEACAGTSCSTTPTVAFHNNTLNWRVDALSGGQVLQSSASGSYTTPLSLALTPETSNPSVCDIWPSIAYDNFIVLDNIWNNRQVNSDQWMQNIAASQSAEGGTIASWTYDWLAESDGDRSAVKAYPEIIYGNKLGTHVSGSKEQTGLPETVNNLPEFTVEFAYSETLDGSVERNVALESFFHDSCDITGPCDLDDNRAYEMMVWVNNPESNRPGDLAVSGVMIDNRLWDVYIKPRSDKKYIAFTAQTPITEGTLQWNRFVEWTMQWTAANADSLNINALTSGLCMAAIEMGTELWWGKGSFTLDKYKITKN